MPGPCVELSMTRVIAFTVELLVDCSIPHSFDCLPGLLGPLVECCSPLPEVFPVASLTTVRKCRTFRITSSTGKLNYTTAMSVMMMSKISPGYHTLATALRIVPALSPRHSLELEIRLR